LVQAQCTFDKIFPESHGITKYKAKMLLASQKNCQENEELNNASFGWWFKPFYLKNDSVYKSGFWYNIINNDCFSGNKNKLYLGFVDDKLYKIFISLNFSKTEFEKCMENYNTLISIFKNSFHEWTTNLTTDLITNEQVSEGFIFYKALGEINNVKVHELEIKFKIEYEIKTMANGWERYQTSNVENYVIEIEYINLQGTKLTSDQY